MLHANIMAVCLRERELLQIEVLHCGDRNFRPFWLLSPWPWPDDRHIRTRPVLCGDIQHVQIWTSYVKAFESYRMRHTDLHADIQTRPIIYAASRVVKNDRVAYTIANNEYCSPTTIRRRRSGPSWRSVCRLSRPLCPVSRCRNGTIRIFSACHRLSATHYTDIACCRM